MTLSELPLSQLLDTCRTYALQVQADTTDRGSAVRTLLLLNGELIRRVLHAEKTIGELADSWDEIDNDRRGDRRRREIASVLHGC